MQEKSVCKKCKKRPLSLKSKFYCDFCRNVKKAPSTNAIKNGMCGLCKNKKRLGNLTLCESCMDKEKKRLLEYKRKHREELNEKNRIYRMNNKEKERARIKDWEKRNPDKVVASRKRRHYARDMLEKSAKGYFSARDWSEILDKYGKACLWCGTKERITIDHVTPLKLGGTNNPDNLQPLCVSCNSKKKIKIIDFRPFGSAIMEWT